MDTVLEGLEKEAREAKKGLWADPQPVPKWEGRKRKERCTAAPTAGIHAVRAIVNEGLNRDQKTVLVPVLESRG